MAETVADLGVCLSIGRPMPHGSGRIVVRRGGQLCRVAAWPTGDWAGTLPPPRAFAFQASSDLVKHGRCAGQLMRSGPPASVDMHADCHPLSHPSR